MSRRNRLVLLLLASILSTACALRVWYASAQPHINRFEDERYSLQNVRKIYHFGDLEPASGYYPSPVFTLPQVWALKATGLLASAVGDDSLRPVGEDGRLTPPGFFVTRLYQAFCGTLTLWLVFLIGRRLMNERVGLLAALSLAFLPWMIHSSGYNKPDALLVMGVCLAFWTSLRAVDSGRLVDYVLAGVSIAIAMSAKLTGGLIAVPLAVATLFWLFRRPADGRLRRIGWLAVAGVTSAAAFVVLNPYWRAYLHFIRGLQRDYASRTDASRLEIPLRIVDMHVGELLFGPIFGTVALVGFAALLLTWLAGLRAAENRPEAHRMAMLLAFPVVYTVAYSAQTSYFKANNFLPIVPFTALALAWLIDRLYERLTTGLRRPKDADTDLKSTGVSQGISKALPPTLAALLSLSLALAFFLPGYRYVERSVVPTTVDAARLWLHYGLLDPESARLVLREPRRPSGLAWEGARQLHGGLSAEVEWQPGGDNSPPAEEGPSGAADLETLAAADAVVLELEHGERSELERRLRQVGFSEFLLSEPSLFKLRGPALLTATRPWQRIDKQVIEANDCGADCFEAALPPYPPALSSEKAGGESLQTVFLWLPTSMAPPERRPRLLVQATDGSEKEVTLHLASRQGWGHLFLSHRFDGDASKVRFIANQDYGPGLGAVKLEAHRWRSTLSPGDAPLAPNEHR